MSKDVLGLWNMGDSSFHSPISAFDAKALIKEALSHGITSFDSAFSYKSADNALKSVLRSTNTKREDIEIISKVMPVPTLRKKVAISLNRLGTDYFDALLIHWPTEEKLLYASLKELEMLMDAGIAREIGVSNFPLQLLRKAKADFPITIHERALSLIWDRDFQEEQDLGLKTYAYAPLGFGTLSERENPDDRRKDLYIFNIARAEYLTLMRELEEIAIARSSSIADIALSWVRKLNPYAIVFGISKKEQLDRNPIELSQDEMDKLSRIARDLSSMAAKDNIFGHEYLLHR